MARIFAAVSVAAPLVTGSSLPPHCDVGEYKGNSGEDLSQTWKAAFGVWCINGQAVWSCPVMEGSEDEGVVFQEGWPVEALQHVTLDDVDKVIFEMTAEDPADLPSDVSWDNAKKNEELFVDIVAAGLGVTGSDVWGSTGVGPGYKEQGWSFQVPAKDRKEARIKVIELGRKYYQGAIYEMVPTNAGAMERKTWPTNDKYDTTVTLLKPCQGPPAHSQRVVSLHVDISAEMARNSTSGVLRNG